MANTAWSSFYNDSNEDVSQLSPAFGRPGTGSREDSMGFPLKDDRRPSVASATTVSSTGSKSSSRGFHKRLPNFFGEDFPADGRQNSETSLTTPFATDALSTRTRNRGNSLNNTIGSYHSRPASPTSSRPRTPQPSSEVTPWEYQDSKVSRY
jgi:adenylate cyclase